eukprot:118260-Prorocentrum_minimum.AAC.1
MAKRAQLLNTFPPLPLPIAIGPASVPSAGPSSRPRPRASVLESIREQVSALQLKVLATSQGL